MIKSLFAGIYFIGFLLIGYFYAADVIVTQDLPAELAPGQSQDVTVQFEKSGVSGFAKYQITVDPGLEIDVVESAGASFTFNNDQAKFIWMSLPAKETFSIKYRITALPNASGSLKVGSRFSYIKENERRNFDLDDSEIRISGTPSMAGELTTAAADSKNENAKAAGERTVYNLGHNQYRVDIVLKKEDLSGFAKIEENIPPNFSAINIESETAVFSVAGQNVKFIWFDIPTADSLTVSYKLLPEDPAAYTDMEVSGAFSFLQNDVTITIPISSTTDEPLALLPEEINQTAGEDSAPQTTDRTITRTDDMRPISTDTSHIDELAQNELNTTQQEKSTVKEIPVTGTTPNVVDEAEKQAPVANKESTKLRGNVSGNISNVPDPEEGVYYRVQIAAGKNNLSQETFAKLYNFSENLKLEHHKSWFKYTTGHHEIYKSARNDRERITALYSKFQGPFVTAYNDGERITVQEALILTEQKWVP